MEQKEPFKQTQEDLKEHSPEKWYDNPNLADFLLFVIPPIGLYCLFKSKKLVTKPIKIISGILVFSGFIWLIVSVIDKGLNDL